MSLPEQDVIYRRSIGEILALLCLQRDGRLTSSKWAAVAVNGGVMLDLAHAGRLTQTADSIEIDSATSAIPAADALSRKMKAHPDRPLTQWLDDDRWGLEFIAASFMDTGVWVR